MAVLLFAAQAAPAGAQQGRLHVRRYTVDDGLAQNHVSRIAQDSTGYLWVGTARGLQRFDGYTFVPLSALDPDAPPELSGPIANVLVDPRGRLWVETPAATYFGHAGRSPMRRHTAGPLIGWDEAAGRPLTLAAGVPHAVDWSSADPRLVRLPLELGAGCCERSVVRYGASGDLWLLTDTAGTATLTRQDGVSGVRRTYPIARPNDVAAWLSGADGRVWLGGYGGLGILDPGADRVRYLSEFHGLDVGGVLPDADGGVLVLTDRWLARVDTSGRIIERFEDRQAFAGSPMSPRDPIIDREGGVWAGSAVIGLLRLDPRPPPFEHLASNSEPRFPIASDFVMALHESDDGALWIGTMGGGLYRFGEGAGVTALRHAGAARAVFSNKIWDLEEDAGGRLWVATGDGVCTPDGALLRCYQAGSAAFEVHALSRAPDGWLWLAIGGNRVIAFDPVSLRFGPSYTVTGETAINSLLVDPDSGDLWAGGGRLHRVRTSQGRFESDPEVLSVDKSESDFIYHIHYEAGGGIWLASSAGLHRWQPERMRAERVDVPELHGTTVFSIARDDRHRLWLGTAHGLVQYSPQSGVARRYGRQDGVRSGEFSRHAALRRRDGSMVFGGLEGLTLFRPDHVTATPDPPLAFTRSQRTTRDAVLALSADTSSVSRLLPGDLAFTVEFAALTFRPGPARRYRYRLEGLQSDWIEAADRSVTYATPPPGRYTFRVQASTGEDGEWTEPGIALRLQVMPPFWRSAWFRALLGLLLAAVIWSLHRLRLRNVVAAERMRLAISRDLHDEIGAGLSSIALLSDALGANNAMAGTERDHLDRIGRSARTMVADLRDIVWAIDPDGDRVGDVISRMRDIAADLLRDTRVSFHAPTAEELAARLGMSARRDLLRIYKEVLHNIVRHARARSVEIRLATAGAVVELVVRDDGTGFDPDGPRTGTGLRSMRERAARIGAQLEIDSGAGGTTVRLLLRRT